MNVQAIIRDGVSRPHTICGVLIGVGTDGITIEGFADNGPPSGLAPRYTDARWEDVIEIRTWDREQRRAGAVLYRPTSVLEGSRT